MNAPRTRTMSVTATPSTLNTRGLATATLGSALPVSHESVTVPTQLSSSSVSWTVGAVAAHPLAITE